MDLYQIWFRGSSRGRNQLCGILLQSAHGFRFCEGSKFAISHWLGQSPLTQCWRYRAVCDYLIKLIPEFISRDMWPPTALIWTWWTTTSAAWCRSECTRLQSATWSSCDSGWLRHGVSSSRAWWTTPLTSGEQDSKLGFRQTVVILNSACDVVCGSILPHHSTTSSFQSHAATQQPALFKATQNWLFSKPPINFD